jgi:hypothetical protein
MAEQIQYRLAAGYPDSNVSTQRDDLYAAIGQKINAALKMEHFNVTLPSGETMPSNAMLAIYDGVAVTSTSNGRSIAYLPIQPISLPRNMGVYSISDDKEQVAFIPLLAGQRMLLKSQPLINDLLGQVGYEIRGKKVEFTKDLTLLGTTMVNMTLAVFDVDSYEETDALPINADLEEQIVVELTKEFAGVQELADAKVVFKK